MTKRPVLHVLCLLLLTTLWLVPCMAQSDGKLSEQYIEQLHKKMDDGLRGVLLAAFMDRNPDSSLASMVIRTKMHSIVPPSVYNIADQTFVLYVPKDYDPHEKYGLMVYISNIPALVPPADWQKVFDKQKMIWISATNAGKGQSVYRRMGLALDAVFNATMRYTIDPERIIVAGMQSGADLASVLAVHYPRTFSGGLFIHSCLYHRDILPTEKDPTHVPEGYRRPMMDKLYLAKTQSRFVIMTGEKASKLPELEAIVTRGFEEDRFRHVQLIVMPRTTIGRPDGKWLSRAIEDLEPITVTAPPQ